MEKEEENYEQRLQFLIHSLKNTPHRQNYLGQTASNLKRKWKFRNSRNNCGYHILAAENIWEDSHQGLFWRC
jgi:hypothetical protein